MTRLTTTSSSRSSSIWQNEAKMINDFNVELRNAFDPPTNLKKLSSLQCPLTHGHDGAVRAQRLSLWPLARKNRRLRP
jgi:hypothetical protein